MGSDRSATFGHLNKGLQLGANHGSLHAEFHQSNTKDDIDRSCFQNLRCPDSLVVKNRLTESKDKLHRQSWEWILQTSEYQSWKNDPDVCLLWIKGGAGKGKTMMAIGLIEELSTEEDNTVAYFFCQNADRALNTVESILKGLIFRLVIHNSELRESLRRRWDTKNDRFTEDCTSWRNLWNILLEMLTTQYRYSSKVYLVVDALDECQNSGMSEFLRLIVRNGLNQPSKLKWLLTSRPLESAEKTLLTGHEQMQVSLELNSLHISQAVEAYISHKLNELGVAQRYMDMGSLKEEMRAELSSKSETTFLWVSLACKQLENIPKEKALSMIQTLPPGLYALYDQAMSKLRERDDIHRYMRFLRAMMLAYRYLEITEIPRVTGLAETEDSVTALVNQCTTFLQIQGGRVEFIHQSTRDYLATKNIQSIIEGYTSFGHKELLHNCLSGLTKHLKTNILSLPRPDSTSDSLDLLKDEKLKLEVRRLDYPATFWVRHLKDANFDTTNLSRALQHASEFLHTSFLEWLECLSLFNKLSLAVESLRTLNHLAKSHSKLSAFVQDATRFLLRHYHTVTHWPLQLYSSAIIFSPESSVVKQVNISKSPKYLRQLLYMEDKWSSRIQTLEGHTDQVSAIAFSPDGKRIASGSWDGTLRLWDHWTGALEMTLCDDMESVQGVAFSPDSKRIASASDKIVRIWDVSTGALELTLKGHSGGVTIVKFSPDGIHIISGSYDRTVRLWDSLTGALKMTWTLEGLTSAIRGIAFSPDGKRIASCAPCGTVEVWDLTGALKMTMDEHNGDVTTVSFSPNGKHIASGGYGSIVKVWDSSTGALKSIKDAQEVIHTAMFSSDGNRLISGSLYGTVNIWSLTGDSDITLRGTGMSRAIALSPDNERFASDYSRHIQIFEIEDRGEMAFEGHSEKIWNLEISSDGTRVATGSIDRNFILWETAGFSRKIIEGLKYRISALAFSPDSKSIASVSRDGTILIWDTLTGALQRELIHMSRFEALAFSPDGKHLASASSGGTVILWDPATGESKKSLKGHSSTATCIEFSRDGKLIASASTDIILWETMTGKLRKKLKRDSESNYEQSLAFSPDGKYLASNQNLSVIELWDLTKCLESPKAFGSLLGGHLKFHNSKRTEMPEIVKDFKFSEDGQFLNTNIGPITLESLTGANLKADPGYAAFLFIRNQWIWYGQRPFLRIPGDCHPELWKSKDDKIVLGLASGRVIVLNIDQNVVRSMLEQQAPEM